MHQVSLQRRIGGIVVHIGVDLPILVVLRWELPCIDRALLLVLMGAIDGVKGVVEEEEVLRHIRDASGLEIDGWYIRGGVAGLDGSVLFVFDLSSVMLFCEALEFLLNAFNFDLHLFRSEERKGIGKVMCIFI